MHALVLCLSLLEVLVPLNVGDPLDQFIACVVRGQALGVATTFLQAAESVYDQQENDAVKALEYRSHTRSSGYVRARFSPCGRFVAAWTSNLMNSSFKSNFGVFDHASGHLEISINGRFRNFFFSPDGNIVVVDLGDTVSIWRTTSGQKLAELDVGESESRTALFRQAGTILVMVDTQTRSIQAGGVTGVPKQKIRLWDTKHWEELPHNLGPFWSESTFISEDAKTVAICQRSSEDHRRKLVVWDLATGKQRTAPSIENLVALFSTDNPNILGIRGGEDWFFWSFTDQKLTKLPTPMPAFLREVSLGNGGLLQGPSHDLASGWSSAVSVDLVDNTWEVRRNSNGRKLSSFPNSTGWRPNMREGTNRNVKCVLNNKIMALASQTAPSGQLCIWNTDEPNQAATVHTQWPIEDLAIASDDRTLAVIEDLGRPNKRPEPSKRVSIIDLQNTSAEPAVLTQGSVLAVQSLDNVDRLAVIFPSRIELWSWSRRQIEQTIRSLDNESVRAVTWLPSGDQVAIATGSSLQLRCIADDSVKWRIDLESPIEKLAISPDGKHIVASTISATVQIKIWLLSAEDGSVIESGRSTNRVDLFHFWGERKFLAIVREENRVAQFDIASASVLPTSEFRQGSIMDSRPAARGLRRLHASDFVAAPHNRTYAIAGGFDGFSDRSGAVRIRALGDGKLKATLTADTGCMNCANFLSSGRKLVAGGKSRIKNRIDLVSLIDGTVAGVIEDQLSFFDWPSPEGDLLLTRHPIDGDILSLWSTKNGSLLARFKVPGVPLFNSNFSPDGSKLLTDGPRLLIWDIDKLIKNGHLTE